MKEKWITGYEDLYKVTDEGEVISFVRTNNKVLKGCVSGKGYKEVCLTKDKKTRSLLVHRLVALAFIPNPEGYLEIDHKNENKLDASVGNLRWCSSKMNKEYYWESRPDRKTKKPQMSQKEYLDKVSKPIIVDGRHFTSCGNAALYIVEQNENKKQSNVSKELRKMINGKRSFGTIYGHVIENVIIM